MRRGIENRDVTDLNVRETRRRLAPTEISVLLDMFERMSSDSVAAVAAWTESAAHSGGGRLVLVAPTGSKADRGRKTPQAAYASEGWGRFRPEREFVEPDDDAAD
ncbi:hypothetical protein JCM9957A_17020 [Kineosporia succinea]